MVCGNFAKEVEGDTVAGGVDSGTIRLLLSTSSHRCWTISTVDVKTAFLQTPRTQTSKNTFVQPPAIMKDADFLHHPGEKWMVTGALYGLLTSPKLKSPKGWNDYRNNQMAKMQWKEQKVGN